VARLPFDPAKMIQVQQAGQARAAKSAAPEATSPDAPPRAPKPDHALTVSQLAAQIGGVLDAYFPATVRVIGEVSNFSNRTHWYFAVKDAGAVLSCVMFANRARAAGFVPEQGQQVVITAKVDFYEPGGKLTLNVERIEPVGAGALELQLRKLVEELRALGWLDPQRKRPLPILARKVAVITSRKGAALADVLDTMRRRCPAVEVCLIDVLVQGASAAPDVQHAINWVSQHAEPLGIDAVLVTRGGGSIEDLWAFNERRVAEAIVQCSIPVVAAIGHETDTTLAELVADLRCATPTQAAMRLTPDSAALAQQLMQTSKRLGLVVRRSVQSAAERHRSVSSTLDAAAGARLALARRRLDALALRLERARPTTIAARRRAALESLTVRLHTSLATRLSTARTRLTDAEDDLIQANAHRLARTRDALAALERQLQLVGPEQVLRRGYSITLGPTGQVVRAPEDVKPADALTTRLAEGEIRSVVGTSLIVPLPRKRRKPAEDAGPSLFGQPSTD
jgi:exodeoxyribonuclease VII large subunit